MRPSRLLWFKRSSFSLEWLIIPVPKSLINISNDLSAKLVQRANGSSSLRLQSWSEQADFWLIRVCTHAYKRPERVQAIHTLLANSTCVCRGNYEGISKK